MSTFRLFFLSKIRAIENEKAAPKMRRYGVRTWMAKTYLII